MHCMEKQVTYEIGWNSLICCLKFVIYILKILSITSSNITEWFETMDLHYSGDNGNCIQGYAQLPKIHFGLSLD